MRLHVDDTKEYLIIDECTSAEYEQIKLSYTKKVKGYRFNPKFKNGSWDGNIYFCNGSHLPASTYKYLFDICNEYGFSCEISNLEVLLDNEIEYDEFSEWVDNFFKDNPIKPRYYQVDAAFRMLRYKRCCAQLATSAGKTLIAFIVFAYLLDHKIVDKIMMVVPKIDLVIQPTADFNKYNNGKLDIKIQQIFSGCKAEQDANIFIGTYQSLCKECQDFFNQFGVVLVDECHLSTSSSQIKILSSCKFPYRFGLSGTIPGMMYADGLTICSNIGPIVINVSANQLQEEGYISNCKITQVRLNYTTENQKTNFKNAKKELVKMGKGKDMFNLENTFVNESEKRFRTINKLIASTNKNTLVLFQTIDYGKKIYKWLKDNTTKIIYYIDGQIDKKVREEIRKRMEVNDDVVLVASFGTSSTGISINNIFNIFFVNSYKSPSTILQSIGRGLRKSNDIGKDFVNIYDISDDLYSGCYEMGHARERIKIYESQCFPYEVKKLHIS
jgi:superfamily II DNA or RNA helicase